jgi:hypothetical protein
MSSTRKNAHATTTTTASKASSSSSSKRARRSSPPSSPSLPSSFDADAAFAVAPAPEIQKIFDLNYMQVLKIRERFVVEAMEQAEIMGKAARALVRIQDEMQEEIDRALMRPPAASKAEREGRHLAWLESFEPEGGVRTQVEAVARGLACEKSETTRPMQRALKALLLLSPTGCAKMPWQQLWEWCSCSLRSPRSRRTCTGSCAARRPWIGQARRRAWCPRTGSTRTRCG